MFCTTSWRFAGALLIAGLAACSQPAEPLRVGANVWPGYGPLHLAQDLGYYATRGIQAYSFPNAMDVMRAYRNHAIDVAAVTADEALLLAQSDPEQRIILICDFSHGADMLLARPEIADVASLRGRRVGVEANAVGAFLLARALESAGMTAHDVTVVPNEMQSLENAYVREGVDAVVVFEPIASRVLARGARRIFDSSRIPGEIVDVLITRESTIISQPQALQTLVTGWFQALTYLQNSPAEGARRIALHTRLRVEEFQTSLQTIKLASRRENESLLGPSPAPFAAKLEELRRVMLSERLLLNTVDTVRLLDGRFVVRTPAAAGSPRP